MIRYFLAFIIAWFIGIFGFSQIIGSLQHARERGIMTWVTIAIWAFVLFGAYQLMVNLFHFPETPIRIGLGISFLRILFAGEIQ